jgi:hypothetical protein
MPEHMDDVHTAAGTLMILTVLKMVTSVIAARKTDSPEVLRLLRKNPSGMNKFVTKTEQAPGDQPGA